MRIVIVDDEPELLSLVRQVLEMEGYETVTFSHPLSLMTLLSTLDSPDLFLIDLMLPEMNGIELAMCLRDGGFLATPKVAISASRQWVQGARDFGLFNDVLNKPFDIDELLSRIEQYALMSSREEGHQNIR